MTPMEREALIDLVEAENESMDHEMPELAIHALWTMIENDDEGWEEVVLYLVDSVR